MSKTILITGASSGLGAEMARQFAALGYDLALCARRTAKLDELKAGIAAAQPGARVEIRELDVTDDDQVFEVFRGFQADFGTIDRIVINAGLGKGAPLGTGRYDANRETAMTNFVAALAQSEAAMEIFREQNAGHFVMISSMSAVRGMPKALTTYAATKAGVAHLAEGLRAELYGKPIKVTVLYPGYIASEMNEKVAAKPRGRAAPGRKKPTPLMATTEKGVRAMVDAIEKEKGSAAVPGFPWGPLGVVMKHAPMPVFKRLI
ncbi:MAG: Short-chain dehydrogenase [Marmoricola sp.]|nr:Short-chain dehydrogenase [Marmoricola sp.]